MVLLRRSLAALKGFGVGTAQALGEALEMFILAVVAMAGITLFPFGPLFIFEWVFDETRRRTVLEVGGYLTFGMASLTFLIHIIPAVKAGRDEFKYASWAYRKATPKRLVPTRS